MPVPTRTPGARVRVRTQLAASFLAVLCFFALNLGVHSWAGARRRASLDVLLQASGRQALATAIARELDDRWREVSVLHHVTLASGQVNELEARLARLAVLSGQLRRDAAAEDGQLVAGLDADIKRLVGGWKRFYADVRVRPAGPTPLRAVAGPPRGGTVSTMPDDAHPDAAVNRLERFRAGEARRTEAATREFARVTLLTDRIGLAIFLVSIVTALVVSGWLWRRIAESLERLREGTAHLGSGNMGYRIDLQCGDELGDVAQAFNGMADSLAAALREARDARDAAERASRAKSAFLANMTHEFRTPMTAILGYADLIEQESREQGLDVVRDDARSILRAGTHMLTLVNDLLDIAKIESGRMTLAVEEFDLEGTVQSVAATLRPLVEEHRNTLVIELPPDAGIMTADPVKVRQTLFNLVGNAAKFTDAGVITLGLTRRMTEAGERVVFTVRDTGIGIAPDRLGSIFEEYEQADASVAKKYGGTGLGLAITQRFCRMMGGAISVESQQGRGTTFTVDLPAVVDPAPAGTVLTLPQRPDSSATVPRAAIA